MMRSLLLSAFLLLLGSAAVGSVQAACSPVINTVSYHFDRSAGLNESNYGLGLECGMWQAGVYRNSEGGRSEYAFRLFDLASAGPIEMGASVGIVHSYTYAPVLPVAALVVKAGWVRALVLPPVTVRGQNIGVIGAQVVLPFAF